MARPRAYETDEDRRAAEAARKREARAALAAAVETVSGKPVGVRETRPGNPVRETPPAEPTPASGKPCPGNSLPRDAEALYLAATWRAHGLRYGVDVSEDVLLAAVARGRAAVTQEDVDAARRLLGR